MGQRGQVAGRAQRALLGNHGGNARAQHGQHHPHQNGTDAGHAHAQRVCPQQQHTAHHLVGIGVAGAGAVAENQIGGQLVAHLLGHGHLLEISKAGGDSISNAVFRHNFFRQRAGLLHGLQRGSGQLHRRSIAGDGHEGLQRQAVSVNDDMLYFRRLHNHFNRYLASNFCPAISASLKSVRPCGPQPERDAP
ncbi:hypothetical protein SDC9_134143 [bioreactor metagenome]|uniref:Uncharacterized protein n=1 Tax=bioreactor metagenome TaxID=1076179 RepID=A0A645DC38_9ZZZZ